jgi:adenylosuccinate lyase
MPHKRNPILTENLTGLARIVRSSIVPALENISLWHERDISHSSVERMIAPDATITLDFAIDRLINVIDELVVYPDQMLRNLNQFGGLVFSQRLLLVLTQKEVSREESYKVVQKNAMLAWESYGSENPLVFEDLIKKDEFITSTLSKKEIEDIFDLKYHTKNIDKIYKRVLEK